MNLKRLLLPSQTTLHQSCLEDRKDPLGGPLGFPAPHSSTQGPLGAPLGFLPLTAAWPSGEVKATPA